MTDQELFRIYPGCSNWRNLSVDDAMRCVELHGGRVPEDWRPAPTYDERQPGQHRPSMQDAPWFYDRDRRYGADSEED